MHSDGDKYIGYWLGNVAHGKGVYYHQGFTTYEGEWYHDLQDGYGVETWDDGALKTKVHTQYAKSRYEGLFCGGQKEGFGVYYWPDGAEYQGEWNDNSINGAGLYIGCDGRVFKGKWHDSVIHGVGKYVW